MGEERGNNINRMRVFWSQKIFLYVFFINLIFI
jgi:hypothetical protein